MNILQFADIGGDQWATFCSASPDAWAQHTDMSRRSSLALDERNKDLSFGVMHNETLAAIVPLVTQPFQASGIEFAVSGSMPTPAPAFVSGLSSAKRRAVFAACMAEVDRLARVHGVARSWMAADVFCSLTLGGTLQENPLLKFGYQDASSQTLIVDLRQDEAQLLRQMNKGHRTDIIFAHKQAYAVDFFDSKNITQDVWRAFITLYDLAAGRAVYSRERWAETFDRVRSGLGLLALIRDANGDKYFSGTLVTTYKSRAYYSMAATDPEYRRLRGIGQLLQWRIMGELKKRGVEFYDMGWQTGSTEKEANIASFKRHFGGEPTLVWAGVKEY